MSARTLTIAAAAAVALLLTGCSGGGDEAEASDTTAAESSSAATSEEPTTAEQDPAAAGDGVVPVGGTFSAAMNGEFEFEYVGLADLGTADGGSAGEIRCYGVAATVTLTTADERFDTGAILVSSGRVLDADGAEIGAIQVLGCPRAYLDAGWADLGSTGFPPDREGVPVDNVILTLVGVPVGDVDKAVAVGLPASVGSPTLAFEVTETL